MSDIRPHTPVQAALGELIATAVLLIAVVGSGIADERLSGGIVGLALLANALATTGALFALIVTFGPVSGAHMNPIIRLATVVIAGFDRRTAGMYIATQLIGAIFGVWLAHLMFDLPILATSTHARTGVGQWVAELEATAGLLGVVWGSARHGTPTVVGAVAVYIGGAYWFTASTSFANPAVTLARTLTESFSGIRPVDAPAFVIVQLIALAFVSPLLNRLNRH